MKRLLLLLPVLLAGVWMGCSKDDDPAEALMTIIHASPDAPAVNLVVNSTPVIQNVSFGNSNGYVRVPIGNVSVQVQPSGTTDNYFKYDFALAGGQHYTLVLLDSVKRIKNSLLSDNLARPAANTAHVRFLHMVPNAPAVDVRVGNNNLFTNRTFNDQDANDAKSGFTPLAVGASGATETISVLPAGGTTPVLLIPGIRLEPGGIYTIVAKGVIGGTGLQTLGASIYQNN